MTIIKLIMLMSRFELFEKLCLIPIYFLKKLYVIKTNETMDNNVWERGKIKRVQLTNKLFQEKPDRR